MVVNGAFRWQFHQLCLAEPLTGAHGAFREFLLSRRLEKVRNCNRDRVGTQSQSPRNRGKSKCNHFAGKTDRKIKDLEHVPTESAPAAAAFAFFCHIILRSFVLSKEKCLLKIYTIRQW
jgi:hypothetical protein